MPAHQRPDYAFKASRVFAGARDLMRYRFLLQLYQLRLDKRQFKRDFGISIERGLPAEMAFMRLNGAFATDDEEALTLTPKGRYLTYTRLLSMPGPSTSELLRTL